MAEYKTTDTELTSIANAIRTKGGTTASLNYPNGFVTAINSISTGGGGGTVSLQAKTVTSSTATQTVKPDASYGGLSQVTINAIAVGSAGTPVATKGSVSNHQISITPSVTNTTGYITGGTKSGTAVTVSASELVSGTQTVTTNSTYDVTTLATMVVNVAGSSGATVSTVTAQNSSNTNSISFTVAAQPKAFMCMTTTNLTVGSTRYAVAVMNDGSNTYGCYTYSSSSTGRRVTFTNSYYSYTYNNNTLKITATSTSNGGYFLNTATYRLIYVY